MIASQRLSNYEVIGNQASQFLIVSPKFRALDESLVSVQHTSSTNTGAHAPPRRRIYVQEAAHVYSQREVFCFFYSLLIAQLTCSCCFYNFSPLGILLKVPSRAAWPELCRCPLCLLGPMESRKSLLYLHIPVENYILACMKDDAIRP